MKIRFIFATLASLTAAAPHAQAQSRLRGQFGRIEHLSKVDEVTSNKRHAINWKSII